MLTNTDHPVDSRTRTCCGGIGAHAAGCLALDVDGHLADAYTDATRGADELTEALKRMDDAPLLASIDVVTARAHLLAAARLIDKAAQRITAAEVTK
ncbi:hypothetical protein [Mycolicibacterium brumae]|uniref:Uncharacterized protein n=1 Tax=Mycolicibacterium brumae TaxID=85968 RepID=A0A2G5PEB1_9MYCO|nr:hypothetical protein [Mycolicibacterium brumae]MCV7191869.1 hypothetical protein [Mycolicibacterium brumae]PIB76254.1 hypothetical protein CQY22_005900 [Mycolicibacterium brumae]RWA15752.1 hypothetical protein MBRU_09375 [Mycolicibacterium brumae DSM 44177]UWW07175.1 hypothetical protein L2Z93_000169 [Mycolicibacterium brumae]